MIVDIATGEIEDQDPDEGKNASAVELGRLGGLKGGHARAKALTPEQRSEIARKAAQNKRGMAKALSLKSSGGNAFMKTMGRIRIGSALGPELREKIDNPIIFSGPVGDPGHGYEATVLIEVCDALVQADKADPFPASQRFMVMQAEVIMRASASLAWRGQERREQPPISVLDLQFGQG